MLIDLILPRLKEAAWYAYSGLTDVLREVSKSTVTKLDDMAVEMLSSRETFEMIWQFVEARFRGLPPSASVVTSLKVKLENAFRKAA